MFFAMGLIRFVGTWLFANCVRPAPDASPVVGSYTLVGAALKSPFRNSAVGTTARYTKPSMSRVYW
jgi:hypothetical protein